MNAPRPNIFRDPWLLLRLLVDTLIAVFGAPSALALRRRLAPETRRRLRAWLKAAEKWTRKRLAREALLLPETKARVRRRARIKPSSRFGRGGFANTESAAWPVHFRAAPRAARARKQ